MHKLEIIQHEKLEQDEGAGTVTYGMRHIDIDPVPVISDKIMENTLIIVAI